MYLYCSHLIYVGVCIATLIYVCVCIATSVYVRVLIQLPDSQRKRRLQETMVWVYQGCSRSRAYPRAGTHPRTHLRWLNDWIQMYCDVYVIACEMHCGDRKWSWVQLSSVCVGSLGKLVIRYFCLLVNLNLLTIWVFESTDRLDPTYVFPIYIIW